MTLFLVENCSESVRRVLDWGSKGCYNVVQDLPLVESLCCVPKQDIICCLVLVQPRKTHLNMTEKLLIGM